VHKTRRKYAVQQSTAALAKQTNILLTLEKNNGGNMTKEKKAETKKESEIQKFRKSKTPFILLMSWICASILVLTYHKYTIRPMEQAIWQNHKKLEALAQQHQVACLDIDGLLKETMVKYAKSKNGKLTAQDASNFIKVIKDSLKNQKASLILAKGVVLKGCGQDITPDVVKIINKKMGGSNGRGKTGKTNGKQ